MTITEIIKKEFEKLSEEYEVYGVFVIGVHNWHLNSLESKISTIGIIIPTIEQILYKKPVSKTLNFGSGKCYLMDIRIFTERCKSGDFQCLETLYSMHKYVNPKYEEFYNLLLEERGHISVINKLGTVNSILNYIEFTEKKMIDMNYDDNNEFGIYGYNRKQLVKLIALTHMLNGYTKNQFFRDLLQKSEFKKYSDMKLNKSAALPAAQKYAILAKTIAKDFEDNNKSQIDQKVVKWLNLWTAFIIKTHAKED